MLVNVLGGKKNARSDADVRAHGDQTMHFFVVENDAGAGGESGANLRDLLPVLFACTRERAPLDAPVERFHVRAKLLEAKDPSLRIDVETSRVSRHKGYTK